MASKRRIRRKACGSKRKYDTHGAALYVALRVKRKTEDRGHVDAYRCRACGKFHWGHN